MEAIFILFNKLTTNEKRLITDLSYTITALLKIKNMNKDDEITLATITFFLLINFTDFEIKIDLIQSISAAYSILFDNEPNPEKLAELSDSIKELSEFMIQTEKTDLFEKISRIVTTNYLMHKFGGLENLKQEIAKIIN